MKNTFIMLFAFLTTFSFAQNASFVLSVDRDTVGLEETFKLTCTFENMDLESMTIPTFKDFEVVGSGGTSSSVQFINGEKTSSISYNYFLKPNKKGKFVIQEEYQKLVSNPVEIYIVEGEGETPKQEILGSQSFDSFFDDFEFPSFKEDFKWRNMEDLFEKMRPQQEPLEKKPEKEHNAPVYQL